MTASHHALLLAFGSILLLGACSPKFDWREVRGNDAPFEVLMPAKPDNATRDVNFGGIRAPMTMTGAEIDGVTFVVGAATLPSPQHAQAALGQMKTALISNIGSTTHKEKTTALGANGSTMIEVEAAGAPSPTGAGQPRELHARFVAKGPRVYQALVVGPQGAAPTEAVETFLSSFKVR